MTPNQQQFAERIAAAAEQYARAAEELAGTIRNPWLHEQAIKEAEDVLHSARQCYEWDV